MRRIAMLILLSGLIISAQAGIHRSRTSLFEIGPKGSLYIGNDVEFGLGADLVFNPIRNLGLRIDFTEIRFGSVIFNFNYQSSLDALIYIPMRGVSPYIHTGFGFYIINQENMNTLNLFTIRAGMGFYYPMSQSGKLFIEPGIIISGNGSTQVTFRGSFGARFGIFP